VESDNCRENIRRPLTNCNRLILSRKIFPVYSAYQTRHTPACTLCASTVRGMAKTKHNNNNSNNKTFSYLVRRSACVFLLTKFIWLFMTTAHYIFTHYLTSVRVWIIEHVFVYSFIICRVYLNRNTFVCFHTPPMSHGAVNYINITF